MSKRKMHMVVSGEGDAAYVYLPQHPGKGKAESSAKQILLSSLVDDYKGPEIYLDFDKNKTLVGIEILLG